MDLTQKPEDPGMELGFQDPDPGEYLWQIAEGIKLFAPEEKQSRAIMFPLVVDQVVNGNGTEDSIGRRNNLFIWVKGKDGNSSDFGEKQLVNLLECIGMREPCAEKFGSIDPAEEKFVDYLAMQAPGKFIKAKGENEKYQGKERFKITGFQPAGSGKKAASKPKQASSSDDWD